LATICRDAVRAWNGRVLVVSHVKELLEQAVDKLKLVCPELPVGVYSAGLSRRDTRQRVIVAGIQSIYKRAATWDRSTWPSSTRPFDTHRRRWHVSPVPDGGQAVSPHLRVIGLTATPYRLDAGSICGPDRILNACASRSASKS
jgi:DNA repair protein RadD